MHVSTYAQVGAMLWLAVRVRRQLDDPTQPGGAAHSQGLTVVVPSIDGVLEPWQFETLIDVIQNVLISPLPQVCLKRGDPPPLPSLGSFGAPSRLVGMISASATRFHCCPQISLLLPATSPRPVLDGSSGVLAAREVLASLTQQLACLHRELLAVAPAVLTTLWVRQGGSLSGARRLAVVGGSTSLALSTH